MRIGFDVDGVLADFNAGLIERAIQVTGEDKFPPRPFAIPTWNYPQHYGYSAEQVSAVWEAIKGSETFWASLPSYDWTMAVLDKLVTLRHDGHDVYFITARPGCYAKLQTEDWLERYGFEGPTVLITAAKGSAAITLDLDTYIDDKPENIQDVAEVLNNTRFVRKQEVDSPAVYLLNQPWNTSFTFQGYHRSPVKRIDNPMQMLNEILPQ